MPTRHQFREFLPYPKDQRRLPMLLSREEVSSLINNVGTLFRQIQLTTLYGTGMRGSHARIGPTSPNDLRKLMLDEDQGDIEFEL